MVSANKKALNKSARFVIYQKSVSTNQNKESIAKYNFNGLKNCFHSNQYLKKLKKTVSTSTNKTFFKILVFLISITDSKKYVETDFLASRNQLFFQILIFQILYFFQ